MGTRAAAWGSSQRLLFHNYLAGGAVAVAHELHALAAGIYWLALQVVAAHNRCSGADCDAGDRACFPRGTGG